MGLPLVAIMFEEGEPIALELIGPVTKCCGSYIGLVAEAQGFLFKFLPALVEMFIGEVAKGDGHVGDEGAIFGLAAVATAEAEACLAVAGEGGLEGE